MSSKKDASQELLVFSPSQQYVLDVSVKLGAGSEGSVHPCIPISTLQQNPDWPSSAWPRVCKLISRRLTQRCAASDVFQIRHGSLASDTVVERCRETGYDYIVMERFQTDAYDYVNRFGVMSEENARLVIFSTLEGLAAMHEENLAHRDIKHENILLNICERTKAVHRAVITDFGLTIRGEHGLFPLSRGLAGSKDFLPPEAFFRSPRTQKFKPFNAQYGDLWAVGVLLTFLVSAYGLGCKLAEREVTYPELNLSKEGMDVLKSLTHFDWRKRRSAKEALAMPWFKKLREGKLPASISGSEEECQSTATTGRVRRESEDATESPCTPLSHTGSLPELKAKKKSKKEEKKGEAVASRMRDAVVGALATAWEVIEREAPHKQSGTLPPV